jgi:ABC-type multidrug transport system fused ATPase/permease subunit
MRVLPIWVGAGKSATPTDDPDHATDMAIQKVLRSEMSDVQMLIVAHRLATVVGLDK